MDSHVDDLDLEMLRTSEGPPSASQHLETCAQCRRRLVFLQQLSAALAPEPVEIPSEVDRRVSMLGARRAASIRRRRAWRSAAVVLVAAAAAALLVPMWADRPSAEGRPDINGDGRLDILDAYTVARGVARGDAPVAWDQNGDGAVDEIDVDQLAFAAVVIGEVR